jgi:CheY-like chemotaxis protein
MSQWRILIVENDEDIARQVQEASADFVDAPDSVEAEVVSNFNDAIPRLTTERYDVLILDLRDESAGTLETEEKDQAGLKVLAELKRIRFLPIVFYTALPNQAPPVTEFVRVVEKTEGLAKLREEVRRVLETQLPALSRTIEEMQRSYMWEFVNEHWKEFSSPLEQADLAYLLARRLAFSLQVEARKLAGKVTADAVPVSEQKIHPIEMYVNPVVSKVRLAGDILKGKIANRDGYWMVLTPSCDFEQAKAENVLVAACLPLNEQVEYANWLKDQADNNIKGKLKSLICDNRQKTPERFKFLPGTFFIPDLVVDFQQLIAIPTEEIQNVEVICSLDSPFGEAVLHRFSRYYGRLGTQDIDPQIVINRLQSALPPAAPPAASK